MPEIENLSVVESVPDKVTEAEWEKVKYAFSAPDKEEIKRILGELPTAERKMSLEEYVAKQLSEALSDENRHEAELILGKVHLSDDDLMLYYAKSGKSESFALENIRYRADQTPEYIEKYYSKYL